MCLLLSIFYFSLVKFVVKFYRWTFLGFFYLCFYIIAAKGERIQSHVVRKHVKWILLCLLIFYKFYMRICRLSMLWFDFSILEGLYFLMDLGIIFHIFRAKTFTCLYSWFTRFPTRLHVFLMLYGFLQNRNYHPLFQLIFNFFDLKISIARIWTFISIHIFCNNSSNVKSWKFFIH